MRPRIGNLLAARLQPLAHHLHLVLLRDVDPQRQLAHIVGRGARRHQRDHLHRLRVVADHALHELDVGAGVLHLREIAGLRRGDHRLGWPGAPGWTIGGFAAAGAAERHDAPAAAVIRMAAIRYTHSP